MFLLYCMQRNCLYTDNSNRADIPTAIGTNTTQPDLRNNLITELSGGSFNYLTSLRTLLLDYNRIYSINDTVSSIIKLNIVELYLTHNQLTTVTFMNTTFSNTLSLMLTDNLITEIPEVFDFCRYLPTIFMDHNQISQIETNAFQVIYITYFGTLFCIIIS